MEFPNGMQPTPQMGNQYFPQQPSAPMRPAAQQPPTVMRTPAAPVKAEEDTALPFTQVPRPAVQVRRPDPVQNYQQEVQPQSEVKIVRRNLTVAELIIVLLIAMMGVSGIQFVWGAAPKPQVNIEWKR
jgi:FtsZ-interacting cell division protein ZipA